MGIFEVIRSACHCLATEKPGQRFQAFFSRVHDLGIAAKIAGLCAGFFLMAFGLFLGLVPGVPGILFGFLGLGLVAAQYKASAVMADDFELVLRRLLSWFRGFFIKPAPRHVERPYLPKEQLQVSGKMMRVADDGQHTGLESRFEEEILKSQKNERHP